MPALSIAALANIMDLFMESPFWRAGQVYFEGVNTLSEK
jgi:hypothetical protein